MSDKDLSRFPRAAYEKAHSGKASAKAWWYEEAVGICVVMEPQEQMTQVFIRWGQIEAALKRKRKAKG